MQQTTEPIAAELGSGPHALDYSLALVIDDDARVFQFVAATLAEHGIRAASFQTAPTALAALDRGHPALIFLDVALLESDAIDVLGGLGARQYAGIVHLMSGGRPSLLDAVQRIGVRHGVRLGQTLNKPVAREAIVLAIASAGLANPPVQPESDRC